MDGGVRLRCSDCPNMTACLSRYGLRGERFTKGIAINRVIKWDFQLLQTQKRPGTSVRKSRSARMSDQISVSCPFAERQTPAHEMSMTRV